MGLVTFGTVLFFVFLFWCIDAEMAFYTKGKGFYVCLSIALAVLIILTIGFYPSSKPIEVETPIYSLCNNSGAHGGFVLGIGSIDEDIYITYMTKDDNGFFSIVRERNDDFKIIEYEGTPKMVRYKIGIQSWWLSVPADEYYYTYFYIPKDSIDYDYNINLNN